MSTSRFLALSVAGVVLFWGAYLTISHFGLFEPAPVAIQGPEKKPRAAESLADALGVDEEDMAEVGGVMRPARDVGNEAKTDSLAARDKYLASLSDPGPVLGVPRDASPSVSALYDELTGEEDVPAARSVIFAPEAFDLESYRADPESWLVKVRPGRALQAKEPGPNVDPLIPVGAMYRDILQGESVILQVELEPQMPVTFHAHLGQFENQLKTISVAASDEGIAQVVYKAVSGVKGPIRIAAASPVHSGRLSYIVQVNLPE